jgi:sortase A
MLLVRMKSSFRFLERSLMVTGCLLLLFYVGTQIHSFLMSRAGLLSFRVHQRQPAIVEAAQSQVPEPKIDFSLWNLKRIQAYKDSLALKLESPIAVLAIPKLGIEVPVFDGTDDLTLNRGVGRISGTAGPGESGNIGVAGHRDGFFRGLMNIQMGDEIELEAKKGKFVYKVEGIEIVMPSDTSVLRPRAQPSLTLVTCYPFYFVGDAPQRYIVHASLVEIKAPTASTLNSAVQQRKLEDTP